MLRLLLLSAAVAHGAFMQLESKTKMAAGLPNLALHLASAIVGGDLEMLKDETLPALTGMIHIPLFLKEVKDQQEVGSPHDVPKLLLKHLENSEFKKELGQLEQDGPLAKEYAAWLAAHGKGADAGLEKFPTWVANSAAVKLHNSGKAPVDAKQAHIKLACNQFCDLSVEEFVERNSCLAPKTDAAYTHLGTHMTHYLGVPKEVDWRKEGAVTPVKNQGQCGSCWTFSTTGSIEGAMAIKTGQLKSVSEQEFVDCDDEGYGCNGGLMWQAMEWAESQDLCSEDGYPYTGKDGTCSVETCTDVVVKKGEITGYKDVRQDDAQAMMSAIAQGPVSVSIEADQRIFQLYAGGVLSNQPGPEGDCGTQLDHGVLAVGYGHDAGEGKDYWIVKNSWGSSWGEDGYIRLEKGLPGDGMCGILADASYPVVGGARFGATDGQQGDL